VRHVLNMVVGLATAGIASAILAIGVAATAGFISHPLESMPWLLAVSAVPAALAGIILGFLRPRVRPTRGRVWGTAALVGLVVVAFAGSVGAILVQSLRFGFSGVNVAGYLAWCGVYAACLLPISVPLAALTVHFAWRERLTTG